MSLNSDRLPFVEDAKQHRNGEPLFDLHDLTANDLALIQEQLRSKRLQNTLILTEGRDVAAMNSGIRDQLSAQSARIDIICNAINFHRHAGTTAERRAS